TPLMQHVVLFQQLVSAYHRDHSASETEIVALQEKVAEDIRAVERIDPQIREALRCASNWEKVKSGWQMLPDGWPNSDAAQRTQAFSTFADSVQTLIIDVGINSKLILNPDVDSYYLVDTIITQMPQFAFDVSKVRDEAALGGIRKGLSDK